MYTTDAIVCGSLARNTADKSYLLFTRELGMVWAVAKSVREERSRQRYGLQDFSVVRVSLIKGKQGWRIGSTEALGNPFLSALSRPSRSGVAYIIKQLRRFVQGEQALPGVFDDITEALTAIAVADTVDEVVRWQDMVVLRLLYVLGYVRSTPTVAKLLAEPILAVTVAAYKPEHKIAVGQAIAQANEVSHL